MIDAAHDKAAKPSSATSGLDTGNAGAGAPTSATAETQLAGIKFAVDKSKRYHQRRRGFFDACHNLTMFVVIICGSAAFAGQFTTLAGFIAALFGAVDLVLQFSHKARDHHDLYRRFSRLGIEISLLQVASEDVVRAFTAKCQEIELEEPPIYWALEADCDNEALRALGRDAQLGLVPLTRCQRLFMNLYRFDRISFPDRQKPRALK